MLRGFNNLLYARSKFSAAPTLSFACPTVHASLVRLGTRTQPLVYGSSSSASVITSPPAGANTMNTSPPVPPPPPTNGIKEVPSGMEAEASLYESYCEAPVLNKVVARPVNAAATCGTPQTDLWLTLSFTQRNLPANAQRKFMLQGYLPLGKTTAVTSLPVEAADALLTSTSPSGDIQVVIKAGTESTSNVLQVWSGNRVTTELHVPKAQHGSLLTGGYFGSDVAWHPQDQAVAYIAESPADEKTPAWSGPESIKDTAAPKSWRGVGTAVEDWGELNTGKRAPAVFVLDVVKKAVVRVSPIQSPQSISYGQPCWAPDGSGLVLVGWPHAAPNFPEVGHRLGVVFCYNRPAQLWWVPLTRNDEGALVAEEAVAITSVTDSALSPVFSPDGSRLVFVSHNTAVRTGTHGATSQLCTLPWPEAKSGTVLSPRVVVDVVLVPRYDQYNGFPGLYTAGLIDQPFIDHNTLLVTTQWRSANAIVAINIDTGALAPVTAVLPGPGKEKGVDAPAGGPYSYSLASITGNRVLALQVAPTGPPQLVVADIPAGFALPPPGQSPRGGAPSPFTWAQVEGLGTELPPILTEHLSNIHYEVTQVNPWVGDTSQPFESLIIAPKNRTGPLPAVIAPHGGPHTAVALGWYPMYSFLAALGYAIVLPNYRGSTGFGQAALQSLPGRIGQQDVDDCMAALDAAVRAGVVDPARVAVVGGSHGGFLTGHLLGQHPDAFKAGVMRNPVCNISLMVGITDITDWCFVEVWGCEEGVLRAAAVPTPEDLNRMYKQSPVAHVRNVKAPVTLMLGAKDRRVPLADGQQYASALRAAGVPVRVIVFPEDSHALDKPQTDFEQWITVAAVLKNSITVSELKE